MQVEKKNKTKAAFVLLPARVHVMEYEWQLSHVLHSTAI